MPTRGTHLPTLVVAVEALVVAIKPEAALLGVALPGERIKAIQTM